MPQVKALAFQEAKAFKTWRIKSSELKTVSMSRIARKNLVNYDDATIYHNDKILIFRYYSVFNEPHFLKKLQRNLWVFLLINVWWVDIYCTLTLFNLHQMYHWKTEESDYIAWGSTQLCVSRFHSCTAIPPKKYRTKKQIYIFRMKKVDSSFLVRLHWSIQNSSCTSNVPMFAYDLGVWPK